jgi:CBS domain-containing protein
VIVLIIAASFVALFGALVLYLGVERVGPAGVPMALLRALAWAGVAALLVDPGCRGRPSAPVVLLDGSLSMTDPSGAARWEAAVDTARRLAAGGPVVLFGATPAPWREGARPAAATSRLLPALREALAHGGPVVVVTDGEVDDATALPPDAMRAVRIVLLTRPAVPDAGIAGVDLPEILVAGDTAVAQVAVVSTQAERADSATVELRENGRAAGRVRVALGGVAARATIRFVPSSATADRVIRRYEVRLSGWRRDGDPRDDTFETAAAVTREAGVVLLSESPDYDFRALARTLRSSHATPVRSFVRVTDGPWRDAATLAPVGDAAVRAAARATLLVVHGPEAAVGRLAALGRHSVWRWSTGPATGTWPVSRRRPR